MSDVTAPPELSTIEVTADGRRGSLTLRRPDKLNALGRVTLHELEQASRWLDSCDELVVVVVSGEGRSFSAGFDLTDFVDSENAPPARETAELGRRAIEAISTMRPVTIARIQGHCIGGGLLLATACDLRVAADDAQFSIPEVDLGIPLSWGGIPRLVRELGPAVTKELVLTCRPVDAAEALALRLVNRVVPRAGLDDEVESLAALLAVKSPFVLRTTKKQVDAAAESAASATSSRADADLVAAALNDSESVAAARNYLADKMRT